MSYKVWEWIDAIFTAMGVAAGIVGIGLWVHLMETGG